MKIYVAIKFMIILVILSTIGMSQPSTTVLPTSTADTINATENTTDISTNGNDESIEADQIVDHDKADQEPGNETGEAGAVETTSQPSPSFETYLFIVAIALVIYVKTYRRRQ